MPNYFYVKSGGTAAANTDAGVSVGTPRSGSFAAMGAANYYDTIRAAMLTGKPTSITEDDIVVVSDLHNITGVADSLAWRTPDGGAIVISVDDTDCQVAKVGAHEDTTYFSGYLMQQGVSGAGGYVFGVDVQGNAGVIISANPGNGYSFRECTFEPGQNGLITIATTTSTHRFKNCTFNFNASGTLTGRSCFQAEVGSRFIMEDCVVNIPVDGYSSLLSVASGDGYTDAFWQNCDFSNWQIDIGSSNVFTSGSTLSGNTFQFRVKLESCKLPMNVTLLSRVHPWIGTSWKHTFEYIGCTNPNDSDNSDAKYFQHYADVCGLVETDITEYLNTFYNGTVGLSLQFSTSSADTSSLNPLVYDIAKLLMDMTVGGIVAVEMISSDAALTDQDVFVEVLYPNETDWVKLDTLSTFGGEYFPGATGTALTSSTAPWNVGTGTKYKIEAALPAQLNGDPNGIITVRVGVTKTSVDLNVDPAITVS